jgi:hypothetical protein
MYIYRASTLRRDGALQLTAQLQRAWTRQSKRAPSVLRPPRTAGRAGTRTRVLHARGNMRRGRTRRSDCSAQVSLPFY